MGMMMSCATLSRRLMERSCLATAELLVAGFFEGLGGVAAMASDAHRSSAGPARGGVICFYCNAGVKDLGSRSACGHRCCDAQSATARCRTIRHDDAIACA